MSSAKKEQKMKIKLAAILALTVILLCPLDTWAQQPVKHFGYLGPTTDTDLSRVHSYTDFTYVDGVYPQSISDLATRVKNNGMRSVIDLGKVLWCPTEGTDLWHLCGIDSEVNYMTRWYNWKASNSAVLNSNFVLAFSVITEHTIREIPKIDVETAVRLVKDSYPDIPTIVTEGSADVERSDFDLPQNADWIGFFAYYTHPNLDPQVTQDIAVLKSKKQSSQRMAYVLDGFYSQNHANGGLTLDNMDTIAQEWYTLVSRDPEAVLICVFDWYEAPDTGGIGSMNFPQLVLDKHAAIGAAIFAGRFPTYQGSFESIDCHTITGWAWDSSQPNTPISVDIYDGFQKIAIVRADQYRQDLANAGIGNGKHGFTFTVPSGLRNGQNHSVSITYGGLHEPLNLSPRSINCIDYDGYIDIADCNSITGWAEDLNRLGTAITVGIYDNTTLVTTVSANQLRTGVGYYTGEGGFHAFALSTPAQFRNGLPHTLRVKFESGATELRSSPRTLTCSP
jgi:hypothetical protein